MESQPIDWDSAAGQKLAESMVLSYKGKAFGISREIQYANTYHLHVIAAMRAICASVAYFTGFALNRKFPLKTKLKIWARAGIYGLIFCFFGGIYVGMADRYYCNRDNAVDKRAARLGPAYAEGGVEYYEKKLERNKALRTLLGSKGCKYYTIFGNEVARWHDSGVKLTTRRDNLKRLFKEELEKNS